MIRKKIFTGAVVAALGLSITTAAFAAETPKTMVTQGMEYQNDASLSNEGVISFEESDPGNLPDGAEHQDETSTTTEGLIYFEVAN